MQEGGKTYFRGGSGGNDKAEGRETWCAAPPYGRQDPESTVSLG